MNPVDECVSYLSNVFDYPNIAEWYEAKQNIEDFDDIPRITEILTFADYAGTILRLAYYHLVHQKGIDVRHLADASVKVYVFGGVYQFQFEEFVNKKELKKLISKHRYPFWTKFGLIGGGIKELNDEGKVFSLYLDELKEKEGFECTEILKAKEKQNE